MFYDRKDIMTLADGKTGAVYIVEAVSLAMATEMRLKALGLTEGTKLRVLNRKRNGGMIIQVRGTRLALGSGISRKIMVQSDCDEGGTGNE